jgi:hypothetical protein
MRDTCTAVARCIPNILDIMSSISPLDGGLVVLYSDPPTWGVSSII